MRKNGFFGGILIAISFVLFSCEFDEKAIKKEIFSNYAASNSSLEKSANQGLSNAFIASEAKNLYYNILDGLVEISLNKRPTWSSPHQVFISVSEILQHYDEFSRDKILVEELRPIVAISDAGFFNLKPPVQLYIATQPDEAIVHAKSSKYNEFDFDIPFKISTNSDNLIQQQFQQYSKVVQSISNLKKLNLKSEDKNIPTFEAISRMKSRVIFKIEPTEECEEQWKSLNLIPEAPDYCRDLSSLAVLDEANIISVWHTVLGKPVNPKKNFQYNAVTVVHLLNEFDQSISFLLEIVRPYLNRINDRISNIHKVEKREIDYSISYDNQISCETTKTATRDIIVEPLNMRTCPNIAKIFISKEVFTNTIFRCGDQLAFVYQTNISLVEGQKTSLERLNEQSRMGSFNNDYNLLRRHLLPGYKYNPEVFKNLIDEPAHILIPFSFRHQNPNHSFISLTRGRTASELDNMMIHAATTLRSCVRSFLLFPIAHEIAHVYGENSECGADRTAKLALEEIDLSQNTGFFSDVIISLVKNGSISLIPNPNLAEKLRIRSQSLGKTELSPECNF